MTCCRWKISQRWRKSVWNLQKLWSGHMRDQRVVVRETARMVVRMTKVVRMKKHLPIPIPPRLLSVVWRNSKRHIAIAFFICSRAILKHVVSTVRLLRGSFDGVAGHSVQSKTCSVSFICFHKTWIVQNIHCWFEFPSISKCHISIHSIVNAMKLEHVYPCGLTCRAIPNGQKQMQSVP